MNRRARVRVDLSRLHEMMCLPPDATIIHVEEQSRRYDREDSILVYVEHPGLPEAEPNRFPPEVSYVIKQDGVSPRREFVEWVVAGAEEK